MGRDRGSQGQQLTATDGAPRRARRVAIGVHLWAKVRILAVSSTPLRASGGAPCQNEATHFASAEMGEPGNGGKEIVLQQAL